MEESNTQNAVGAQAASGVPPNNGFLTPGNTLEIRNRTASTLSYFSIASDASSSGPTPENATGSPISDNELDKTLTDMLEEI